MRDSLSLSSCTIKLPSLWAWIYAITVHGTCCVVGGVLCGTFLYRMLPKNARTQNSTTEKARGGGSSNAMRSCVSAFVGIAAASSVYLVRPVIERYSPHDEITWAGPFLASTFGFTTFFKSLNVAFDAYPEGADTDLSTWLMWFVMTPEPTFAKGKLCKANRDEFVSKTIAFLSKIVALCFLLTALLRYPPPHYNVVTEKSSSSNEINDGGNVTGTFSWLVTIHVNGFFHLWLLYLYSAFCLDFSILTNCIVSGGVRMEPGFINPLLGSRSFKEAWGSRYNRPVNALLKRTVYIPARKSGCDRAVAAMLTFLASGLLHEYNFAMHNHRSLSLPSGYRPGEATMFFLVIGLLMVGESWVWNRCFPRWLRAAIERLPSFVTASMLTVLVCGLAELYFLRGWFQSGFVEAVAEMLPHAICK
mmetsp:Transcript_4654/g.9928  ORF Transcript_4654/g.9928 Transcript_4654/m.9928 type:complete len:418 (-) Transcript_4654:620-1873(-)